MRDRILITGDDLSDAAQSLRYEWSTIGFALANTGVASDAIDAWASEAGDGGVYLGAWITENGKLGSIRVLRRFTDADELQVARRRLRLDGHPLSQSSVIESISVESFAPFPFMPPVETGALGPVYEIRDYVLRPGSLPGTIEAWRAALPHRHPIDPIVVVMYAIDGPDRILHVWPFAGLDERVRIRRDLYADGVWPPPGAPELIAEADSIIAWPLPRSPLS